MVAFPLVACIRVVQPVRRADKRCLGVDVSGALERAGRELADVEGGWACEPVGSEG